MMSELYGHKVIFEPRTDICVNADEIRIPEDFQQPAVLRVLETDLAPYLKLSWSQILEHKIEQFWYTTLKNKSYSPDVCNRLVSGNTPDCMQVYRRVSVPSGLYLKATVVFCDNVQQTRYKTTQDIYLFNDNGIFKPANASQVMAINKEMNNKSAKETNWTEEKLYEAIKDIRYMYSASAPSGIDDIKSDGQLVCASFIVDYSFPANEETTILRVPIYKILPNRVKVSGYTFHPFGAESANIWMESKFVGLKLHQGRWTPTSDKTNNFPVSVEKAADEFRQFLLGNNDKNVFLKKTMQVLLDRDPFFVVHNITSERPPFMSHKPRKEAYIIYAPKEGTPGVPGYIDDHNVFHRDDQWYEHLSLSQDQLEQLNHVIKEARLLLRLTNNRLSE